MKKRTVIACGLISFLTAVLLYFLFASTRRVVTFQTLQVNHGPISETLTETGTIQFARTVTVKPTVSGEVRHIHVDIGDRIAEGAVLAVIEPDPSQSLQLSRQRARVDGARIDLAEQEMVFKRKRELHDRSLISLEEFDKAKIEYTKALHNLRMAELKVNVEVDSNVTHAAVRIMSPLSGIVISRRVEAGEVVVSGTSSYTGGTEMFRIGDPGKMIVRSAIGEIDAGRVESGQDVRIRVDAYPDATYSGRVDRVSPVGVQRPGTTLVTFDTDIVILNPSPGLQQGMSCDIDIVVEEKDRSIRVPPSAVLELDDNVNMDIDKKERVLNSLVPGKRRIVYRCTSVDQERKECPVVSLETSLVEIGIESINHVEIVSGLEPGALIAIDANAVHIARNLTH